MPVTVPAVAVPTCDYCGEPAADDNPLVTHAGVAVHTRSCPYLPTVEVAKRIRAALKQTFPGVKFAVRKDRGTAGAWIDIWWADGPAEAEVKAVCDRWVSHPYAVCAGVMYTHAPERNWVLR